MARRLSGPRRLRKPTASTVTCKRGSRIPHRSLENCATFGLLLPYYSLGIDIGGTFTDIVVYDHARAQSLSHKELTTPEAPHEGVVTGIKRVFQPKHEIAYRDVSRVVHATTLFTNALIERKGAPTGLITTAGFPRHARNAPRAQVRALRSLHRAAEAAGAPQPAPGSARAHERDGTIETPLDDEALLAAAARAEARRRDIHRNHFPARLRQSRHARACCARCDSQRASRAFRVAVVRRRAADPRVRAHSTTVANAYIKPLADSYLDLMSREIARWASRRRCS